MRLRKILMVASVTFACVAQAQDLTIHVNKKGKVGFVDKNGAEVIKCAYESAYPFSGGYAIVTKSGKSGIIDERGKVVLPLKYTSIMPWNQSLYLIKTEVSHVVQVRAEGPKAPSPGHRPGYNGNQQGAL